MESSKRGVVVFLMAISVSAFAAAPPTGAPPDATGLCKDGTYYTGPDKKGACRGHKGVKDWYASTAGAAKGDPSATTTPPAVASASPAATPPAGATALCKDGTYFSGTEKKGACRGHKGVKDWYGAVPSASPAAAKSAETPAPFRKIPPPPATATPTAPGVPSKPVNGPSTPVAAKTSSIAPANSTGMVWANSDTKIYHCPNTRWYGKTKKGEYMTEADATAKGFRADHGKSCQ